MAEIDLAAWKVTRLIDAGRSVDGLAWAAAARPRAEAGGASLQGRAHGVRRPDRRSRRDAPAALLLAAAGRVPRATPSSTAWSSRGPATRRWRFRSSCRSTRGSRHARDPARGADGLLAAGVRPLRGRGGGVRPARRSPRGRARGGPALPDRHGGREPAPALVPRRPRAHGARDPRRLGRLARTAGLRGPARLLGLRLRRGMGDAARRDSRSRLRPTGRSSRRSPRPPHRPGDAPPQTRPTSTRSPIRSWRWARTSPCCASRAARRSTWPALLGGKRRPGPDRQPRGAAMDTLVTYFGSAPFDHYTAHLELLKPISPDHSYGFSMEHLESSHYFLAADAGVTPLSPEPQRRRALFNFAHHVAARLDPEALVRRGLLPLLVGARAAHRHDLAERGLRALHRDRGARRRDAGGQAAPRTARRRSTRSGACLRRCRPSSARCRSCRCRGSPRPATRRTSAPARRCSHAARLLAAALDERIRRSEAAAAGASATRPAHLVEWSAVNRRGFRTEELPGLFQEPRASRHGTSGSGSSRAEFAFVVAARAVNSKGDGRCAVAGSAGAS